MILQQTHRLIIMYPVYYVLLLILYAVHIILLHFVLCIYSCTLFVIVFFALFRIFHVHYIVITMGGQHR